jgi:hypothetical protein
MKLHCHMLTRVLNLLSVVIFFSTTQNVRAQMIAHCDARFGTGIEIFDCVDIEGVLFYGVPPGAIEMLQTFSLRPEGRTASLPRQFPQGSDYQSCGIGVDLDSRLSSNLESETGGSIRTSYRQIQAGMRQLVTHCVKFHGTGGFLRTRGMVFIIANPNMVPQFKKCLWSADFRQVDLRECLQRELGILTSSSQIPIARGSLMRPPVLPPHWSLATLDTRLQRAPQRQQGRLESSRFIPNIASSTEPTESEIEKQDDTSGPRLFSFPPSDHPTGYFFNLGDRGVRSWLWSRRGKWISHSDSWQSDHPPNGAWQAVQFRQPWEVQSRFPREMPSPTRPSRNRRLQILQRIVKNQRSWAWQAVGGSWKSYEGKIPTMWMKRGKFDAVESGWYLIKYDFNTSMDSNKVVPSR